MNWCSRPLMRAPIAYGLCLSQAAFDEVMEKLEEISVPFLGGAIAQTHFIKSDNKWRIIVCMKPSRKPVEYIYAVLVHEAVHVWQHFREHIGETKAGDEQEAYCIETISYNLMQSYKKQVGK